MQKFWYHLVLTHTNLWNTLSKKFNQSDIQISRIKWLENESH